MDRAAEERIGQTYHQLTREFDHWEKTKDLVDQLLDVTLNYRQSGHPGGSRSKVHALLVTLLSGVMRWDIRHPEKRFGDRFVLVGGHTIPLIYTTLALLNEALRVKYTQTKDKRYLVPKADERALVWEDLALRLPARLSGHAEMEGKTLFLKLTPACRCTEPAVADWRRPQRAGAEAQGLRVRGRGRADAGCGARYDEFRLGTGAGQPVLRHRLERLRHRRPSRQHRRPWNADRLVRAARVARVRRRVRQRVGAGDAGDGLHGLR
jgi:transketolase